MAELRIKELYRSIQGESTFAGWPCVFVRTAGCDIRCVYCDEAHAFSGGERLSSEEILARVGKLGTRLVEVTGGEPLAQKGTPELVRELCDAGYEVLVETGGHHDISVLDPRAHAIVDVKTPGSGMSAHNHLANLERLRPGDEVKFVLCDRADYDFAKRVVREHPLEGRVPVHFSPVHPGLDPRDLAAWILADGLRVRLNLQLHKYVWGADAKSV
ncbi:MAG TPA: 7-carboxy-7-deazaguanine synthase QueE, partial [Myxococcota bacterium]|nr:7-carboxy-7-deazaguanine synthase QueE [Myxococcota bacterium]